MNLGCSVGPSNLYKTNSSLSEKVALVVEDNPAQLKSISDLLGSEFKVLSATNYLDALNLINKRSIGLLITDLKMDGSDGLQLIKKFKDYDKTIKTILVTGYSSEEVAIRALQIGVDYYFVKPISPNVPNSFPFNIPP